MNIKMLKKLVPLLFLLAFGIGAASAAPVNAPIQGFCEVGGIKVTISGSSSTNTVQGSYPRCLVTVYLTGTATKASIFSDIGGTVLANPFTANINASWLFYALNDAAVDVVLNGGTPIAFPAPYTIVDVIPGGGSGGGGGGSGSASLPLNSVQIASPSGSPPTFTGSVALMTDPLSHQALLANSTDLVPQVNHDPNFAFHNPFNFQSAYSQALSRADFFLGSSITMNIDSGTQNLFEQGIQGTLLGLNFTGHSPGQGGGTVSQVVIQNSPGDTNVDERIGICNGVTRLGQDEQCEPHRHNVGMNNRTFGGVATISSPNAQGNVPIQLSNFGIGGYQPEASAEGLYVIDLTKAWNSTSDIASINFWSTDGRFYAITGTAGSGIDTHFPTPSSHTTLIDAVDSQIYQPNTIGATCPNVTPSGTYPGSSAFLADRFGVNIFSYSPKKVSESNPSNYCYHVASTSGLSPGTIIYITDTNFSRFYTKIETVPDSTHFTAQAYNAVGAGAFIGWGGAVGTCASSPFDDRAPGTSNNFVNQQPATTRLCYPIIANESGNKLAIDTSSSEVLSLALTSNVPKAALTITPTIVGGVITSITSNALATADYNSPISLTGLRIFLPPPAITYTCTTPPVITLVSQYNEGRLPYIPTLVSGGTGCTGLAVATTTPNPLTVYPVTIAYRVTDPACPNPQCELTTTPTFTTDPDVWANHGYVLGMPSAVGFSTGDQLSSTRWPYRNIFAQEVAESDPETARSGSTGTQYIELHSFMQSNQAVYEFDNTTPTKYQIGTYPNWGLSLSDPKASSVNTGPFIKTNGLYSSLISMNLPPTGSPIFGPSFGGAVIDIGCSAAQFTAILDSKCLHNQFDGMALFSVHLGGSSVPWAFGLDPNTGASSVTGPFSALSISTSSFITPSITVGDDAHNGTLKFSASAGGASPVSMFTNCYIDPTKHYIALTLTSPSCNLNGQPQQPVPDGLLGVGEFHAESSSQTPFANVALEFPQFPTSSPIYSGTAGAVTRNYNWYSVDPSGLEGALSSVNCCSSISNTAATLDGSHFVTVPCPSTLQYGYPAGSTYHVVGVNLTTSAWYDMGNCPVGGTVVDNGSGASIPGPPNNGANGTAVAGHIGIGLGGDIRWFGSRYNSLSDVGFSRPTANTLSLDGNTAGDGLGMLKAASISLTGTGFPIRSGTSSNTDLNGKLTLAAGTASYAFTSTGITTAPVCVATDTTAVAAVQVATSTTTLTINGTGTDIVNYICVGLN